MSTIRYRFVRAANVPRGMFVRRARISPDGTTLRLFAGSGFGLPFFLALALEPAANALPETANVAFATRNTHTTVITDDSFVGYQTAIAQRAPNTSQGGAVFIDDTTATPTSVQLHRSLPSPPRPKASSLIALNCHGEAIGSATWGKDDASSSRALLYLGHSIRPGCRRTALPEYLPLPEDYSDSEAIGIDDFGNVLGTARKMVAGKRVIHGFVWPRVWETDAPPAVRLRNHSGRQTAAAALAVHEMSSTGGLVVVGTTEVQPSQVAAAYWRVDDKTGSHTALRSLGGMQSSASAGYINAAGALTVFGGSTTRDSQPRATRWDDTQTPHDLNLEVDWGETAVPPDLTLAEVVTVDDRGRLVVYADAVLAGYFVLLEPVS